MIKRLFLIAALIVLIFVALSAGERWSDVKPVRTMVGWVGEKLGDLGNRMKSAAADKKDDLKEKLKNTTDRVGAS